MVDENKVYSLVNSISAPGMRDAVKVYSDIAFSNYASSSDIDRIHRVLLSGMEKYKKELLLDAYDRRYNRLTESKRDSYFEDAVADDVFSVYKKLKQARTRSEKIIAIDAAMHLQHDQGSLPTFGIWDDYTEGDISTFDKVLAELSR